MNIITKNPVFVKNNTSDSHVSFEGRPDVDYFLDESGEEFYSADGENFFNAKGENVKKDSVKGVFKKIGKGFGKAAKFIGKGIVKASRSVVKASKNVASGVKKVGGKAKAGSKKLIHHKKRDGADKGSDVFTKPLTKATPEEVKSMPQDKVVEIEGEKYLADGIDKDKPVTVSQDPETGEKVVGVEYKPEEVVAVDGADGNVEYHTPDSVGMSKNMKIALIVTGAALVLGIVIFVVIKSNKSKNK